MQKHKGQFTKGDPRIWKKGRTKGEINLTDLVRRIAAEPAGKAAKMSRIEAVVCAVFARAFEGDMRAVEIVTERGWGKAVMHIESRGVVPLVTIIQEMPRAEEEKPADG